MRRFSTWRLLAAVVGILAVTTTRAECPENPDDCVFAYTNIRLESSTPEGFVHGGSGGTVPPPQGSPGTGLLNEVSTSDQAAYASSNPFSSVDLSSFSQEDLEARRDLLLSILAQTNAELGVPPTPRAFDVTPAAQDQAAAVEDEEAVADVVIETETETEKADEEGTEEKTAEDKADEEADEEADESAPTKDARSSAADEGSSSFFKNLLGSSSKPTSSASTFTLVAGALTVLLTV